MDGLDCADEMNTTLDRRTHVPAAALLDTWNTHRWPDGVRVDRLAALDRVTVVTFYSTYEIVVVSPADGRILVRGGRFFPEFTSARLAGATLGGSLLKLHAIHPGFQVEISLGPRYVLTSPVRSVTVAQTPAARDLM